VDEAIEDGDVDDALPAGREEDEPKPLPSG